MLWPATALAEVSDKLPGLPEIWGVAALAALAVGLAARFKPWWLVVVVPWPALWFLGLGLEIHSADVGPAIVREQGVQYVWQACVAGLVVAVAGIVGAARRRQRMRR